LADVARILDTIAMTAMIHFVRVKLVAHPDVGARKVPAARNEKARLALGRPGKFAGVDNRPTEGPNLLAKEL
jgi:hypothetical protein